MYPQLIIHPAWPINAAQLEIHQDPSAVSLQRACSCTLLEVRLGPQVTCLLTDFELKNQINIALCLFQTLGETTYSKIKQSI